MLNKTEPTPDSLITEAPSGIEPSQNGPCPSKGVPDHPVHLGMYTRTGEGLSRYPILLESVNREGGDAATNGGLVALSDLLSECFENTGDGPASEGIGSENFEHLLKSVAQLLVGDDPPIGSPADFLESVSAAFSASSGLKTVDETEIADALKRFWAALSSGIRPIGRRRASLGAFYLHALTHHRQRVLERFGNEAGTVLRDLEIRLQLDQSHSDQRKERSDLNSAYGASRGLFMDMAKLEENLPPYRGTKSVSGHRRTRLEKASTVIREWLKSREGAGGCHLVSSSDALMALFPEDVKHHRVDGDSLGFASEQFERLAGETVEFLRALYLGCLELEGIYEPSRDDEFLDSIRWQSLTDEEIKLIPPVIVLEDASQVRGKMMNSFIEYLDSSRPLHTIIVGDPKEALAEPTEGLYGRSHSGLTAYAMANGRVAVLQSSLAHPEHLCSGFQKIVGLRHPKVSLVSVPEDAESGDDAWQCAEAAILSRATPCLFMQPEAGDSWAECINLQGNPNPGSLWPEVQLRRSGDTESAGDSPAKGENSEQAPDSSWRFTLADYAVFDPRYAEQLKPIPSSEKRRQVPVADFLDLPPEERTQAVPYTAVISLEGEILRREVGPAVIKACQERMRHWRLLQDLCGINSEYVRRAEKVLRKKVEQEKASLRAELVAQHRNELEKQRKDVAGETISSLVNRLVGCAFPAESLTALTSIIADGTGQESTIAEISTREVETIPARGDRADESVVTEKKSEPPVGNEPDADITEPFLESARCTSCNECTNLNPAAFKYDENKQAYLADQKAASFADLVKAASKCPAACIHPGQPRSGDTTATPSLIRMAAKYN